MTRDSSADGGGIPTARPQGDSPSLEGLSLAVLECEAGEAEARIAALGSLAETLAGAIRVTEVTSTCLAVDVEVPAGAAPRLAAGLRLGGATIVQDALATDRRLMVILALRAPRETERGWS